VPAQNLFHIRKLYELIGKPKSAPRKIAALRPNGNAK
jgi:hypothetical protein